MSHLVAKLFGTEGLMKNLSTGLSNALLGYLKRRNSKKPRYGVMWLDSTTMKVWALLHVFLMLGASLFVTALQLFMKWISPFVYILVYNDNGSVQTLCITRVSALCTKCLHRPIVIINQYIHKGWNSFYIFTLFSCVWILFYQSLSWKWPCFSWKSNGMHSKWKSLEK